MYHEVEGVRIYGHIICPKERLYIVNGNDMRVLARECPNCKVMKLITSYKKVVNTWCKSCIEQRKQREQEESKND